MQQDSVFQMRDIAAALPVVTPDSKLGDILSPEVQQTTFAHTIGPEWWKEYTVEEFLEFATKHIENKDISHLRDYVQALLPEQPVIDCWSALKTLNFLGDHPTSNHYLVLSPAFRRESSLRSAPSTKTIYKTLVISGESGSGKSMFATYGVAARISDEKTTANSKTHVITLYHKLSGEHDLTASLRYVESLGTRSIEKRNNACLKILLKLWLNCSATICKDHFHGDKSAWNEAEIVFVLDEASSFPIFVRGAIAVSGEFQRKVLYEGEHQPVSLQLVLVGTALSYHTNPEDSSIASDPELYVSKQLISWNADNFKTYAREFLRRDVSNEIIEGVVDMVLSIPSLSTLGRNGRCANFLVAALRTRINSYWSNRSLSFILNSIRLSVSSIIYAVADQYRIANGFGDLFNSKPSEFEESSLLCLKFSMQPDLVVAEEKERVQNLLIYGILSYADGKFCISSTILLLCLCRFGTGDQLLVTNCDEFKHVVALRAMVKARIDNPARPVRIVFVSTSKFTKQ